MIKKYNKLVRDKIPKIIEENGQMCETEILSDERYLEMLELKLSISLPHTHLIVIFL